MQPSQDTTHDGTHCGTVAVDQPSMRHVSANTQKSMARVCMWVQHSQGPSGDSIEGIPACRQVWMALVLGWLEAPKRAATAGVAASLLGTASAPLRTSAGMMRLTTDVIMAAGDCFACCVEGPLIATPMVLVGGQRWSCQDAYAPRQCCSHR